MNGCVQASFVACNKGSEATVNDLVQDESVPTKMGEKSERGGGPLLVEAEFSGKLRGPTYHYHLISNF